MSTSTDDALGGTFLLGGDLPVRRLGFGAMRITGRGIWGDPPDREAAKAVLRRAVELGITLIDTADSYGPNVSEELIAEAQHPYPDDLVIATKGGLLRTGPGQWPPDGRPEHLKEACEGSLRRLRVDRIDLYQLHRPDPAVPYEDSVGALAELQAAGKIRHVGVSNVTVDQLATARSIVPVVSVQNRYNLADRASEDVLQACERDGIALVPPRHRRPGQAGERAGRRGSPPRGAARPGGAGLAAAPQPGRPAHPRDLVGGPPRGERRRRRARARPGGGGRARPARLSEGRRS
jgi:diketogulonate reductase-like aldo/keto reductase